MKLSIFIDAVILLLLLFFLKKKKLLLLENLFLLIILEFLVTTYCAILFINLDVWKIAKRTDLFIIFRIYEVVVNPVIWMFVFNILEQKESRLSKLLSCLIGWAAQVGVELWLRQWGVIVYLEWNYWESFLVQGAVFLFTMACFNWYRKGLRSEGSYKA